MHKKQSSYRTNEASWPNADPSSISLLRHSLNKALIESLLSINFILLACLGALRHRAEGGPKFCFDLAIFA
jgi:hypothetical protein